jgi:hypothetical protein
LLTSGVLAIGLVAAPAASAQQQGLVNVDIDVQNVLNNNEVAVAAAVPIQAAANVCGISVTALSTQLGNAGFVNCDAGPNQQFHITQTQ